MRHGPWIVGPAQNHEGPRSARLVLHSGSTTKGKGINEQAAVPDQTVPKKILKSAGKGASGSSKKKVSFGSLEESFTNSDKYISFITDKVLEGLRSKYHIPNTVKLRAPTADERPHMFTAVRSRFILRPLMPAFVSHFTHFFGESSILCM